MNDVPKMIGGALALLAVAMVAAALAQEPPVNAELIEAALKLTQEAAADYEFETEAREATLRPEPLLRWSNPAAGEIHGNVFLWTVNDRPAVIGSFYKWFSPFTHGAHEFQSLSEAPVTGRYHGAAVWRPQEAGVQFAPLADGPSPADSATQRLLQMRRLARQFAVTKTDRDGSRQELRLLPQPIYRYATPQQEILDGGLFVFVQGTDPEVFLMLEARGKEDAARWTFAAARMNSVDFRLRRDGREMWGVEIMPWREVGRHAKSYTTFRRDNVPLATPSAESKETP